MGGQNSVQVSLSVAGGGGWVGQRRSDPGDAARNIDEVALGVDRKASCHCRTHATAMGQSGFRKRKSVNRKRKSVNPKKEVHEFRALRVQAWGRGRKAHAVHNNHCFSAWRHLSRPPALIRLRMGCGGPIDPHRTSVASEPPSIEDITCRGYRGERE